jgi:regulator of protease activity HflC (stomatin/prohibitin superfamily)
MAEIDRLIVSFFVDEFVGGFFISVPPGHIACLYDRGRGVLNKVWGPGLHLKIPFWQVAKLFNAQVIEYTIRSGFDLSHPEAPGDQPISAVTADKQQIYVEGAILFKIDKTRAPELWENVGEKFISKVVRPVSRSRIRSVLSEVSLPQITTYRPKIEDKIQHELNKIFNEKALVVERILLSDIKHSGSTDLDRTQEPLIIEQLPPR